MLSRIFSGGASSFRTVYYLRPNIFYVHWQAMMILTRLLVSDDGRINTGCWDFARYSRDLKQTLFALSSTRLL